MEIDLRKEVVVLKIHKHFNAGLEWESKWLEDNPHGTNEDFEKVYEEKCFTPVAIVISGTHIEVVENDFEETFEIGKSSITIGDKKYYVRETVEQVLNQITRR